MLKFPENTVSITTIIRHRLIAVCIAHFIKGFSFPALHRYNPPHAAAIKWITGTMIGTDVIAIRSFEIKNAYMHINATAINVLNNIPTALSLILITESFLFNLISPFYIFIFSRMKIRTGTGKNLSRYHMNIYLDI